MRSVVRALVVPLVLALPALASAKPWVPHPIHVIPGVPLKAADIKPYEPPKLLPEPPLEPSDVKVVEVTTPEAVIEIRPWTSPMVGNAIHGARLPVKGVVKSTRGGCSSHVWYALEPFGYLCGHDGHPTDQPATTEQLLKIKPGTRLPFTYVMELVKEGDKVPMWASLDDMKAGAQPERMLERGDTTAVDKPYTWDGQRYWINVDGKVIPQKGAAMMGGGAEWHGIEVNDKVTLPFGWVTPEKANIYAAPPEGKPGAAAAQLERRTRVNIVDERLVGKKKWLKVTFADPPPPPTFGNIMQENLKKKPAAEAPPGADGGAAPAPPAADNPIASLPEAWIAADSLNEVRLLPHPTTVPATIKKWIDIDLGEQVLVTYDDDKPTFATLVSSGRAIPTPMGTYPVWAKVSAITMKNQPYEDKEYYVNKVPWSTFFQWHNAIHGAYWHDRFGVVKSHGCVNVAPLDAKHVFEWVEPPLPPGWTGLRPLDLLQSPYVVTRNSHMKKQFRQDRPIGPPDRSLEAQRLEEADAARAAAAAQAAQQADTAGGAPKPTTPATSDMPSVAAPNATPPPKP
ncbi:MAG TPA: L,D-transpeptidase family protein [Polyangia bacterium]|nr:L,D-transpeptidase family protein [Polyangia bacterium]